MGELIVIQKSLILFNKKVLLLQDSGYKQKAHENRWGLVGGWLEFGESLLEGLTREIKEETGLNVCVDKLLWASSHVPARPEQKKQAIILYYLSYANTDQVYLSEEHKNYLWANHSQIMDLIDKPVIDDIKSFINTLEIE